MWFEIFDIIFPNNALLYKPLRMRPFPAGEGVCGESTVDESEMGLIVDILQIREVFPQLGRRQ